MKRLILVDACNILHRLPGFRNRLNEGMDQLAEELLQLVRCLHDLEHCELHLIVDGTGSTMDQQFPSKTETLSILYSASAQTADSIIEKWLLKLGNDWSVTVASEDRAILHAAIANNADVLSADQLVDWASRVQSRFARANQLNSRNSSSEFGNRLEGLS